MRLLPTPSETEFLRFAISMPRLAHRYLLAAGLFLAGLALWMLAPPLLALVTGPPLLLLGHLPLWVRGMTTAPGGATPQHEERWAPAEDGWLAKIVELERRGKSWDTSPWDLTSGRGCAILLAVVAGIVVAGIALAIYLAPSAGLRFAVAGVLLVVPQWLNGMRTIWNPSELRLKGQALEIAAECAEPLAGEEFDRVPLLALREGPRGDYPVDARLMLRPRAEDGSGFLGVQVQVSLNNVRGTDYPYLYCVVLGKEGFRLPPARGRFRRAGGRTELVSEAGVNQGVRYLVVRQHADTRGGWHTGAAEIGEIVDEAISVARRSWQENRGEARG